MSGTMQAFLIATCAFFTIVASSPLDLLGFRTLRFRRDVPTSSYALPMDTENKFASPPLVAAGAFGPPPPSGQDKTATTKVHEEMTLQDGSFNIRYQTSNGISTEMKGYPKGGGQAMEGSFSYTAPDGRTITTRWTADETGFHPVGNHLHTYMLRRG